MARAGGVQAQQAQVAYMQPLVSAQPSRREHIASHLLQWYDRCSRLMHATHTHYFAVRLLLFPFVLLLYIPLFVIMLGVIIHVPAAQVFAYFETLDPKSGYTVSFVEYQHRLLIAQILIISGIVVFVCLFYTAFVIPALGLYR